MHCAWDAHPRPLVSLAVGLSLNVPALLPQRGLEPEICRDNGANAIIEGVTAGPCRSVPTRTGLEVGSNQR
jgi:hypothetical protein